MSVTEYGVTHQCATGTEGNAYTIGVVNQRISVWLRSRNITNSQVWCRTGWGIENSYNLALNYTNAYNRSDFGIQPIIRLG